MHLPSLKNLFSEARNSLIRFLPALLLAGFGTLIALILTSHNFLEKEKYEHLYRFIFCAALGLPMMLSIKLYSESVSYSKKTLLSFYGVGFLLLIGYFFTLPKAFETVAFVRFLLLNLGLHLLVSFSAFSKSGNYNAFWQFNKTLFLRFLTAALFSGVLFIGLSLAILAVNKLFNVNINELYYLRLWIVLAGIFNTWFFIAGIPAKSMSLEENKDYPKGLKIFTQFVLLPIVSIYIIILYAYSAKVVFLWNLPQGWVSNLVLSLSIVGVFSLLLIHPLRETDGNKWIKIFSKFFYVLLFPLLLLLAVAIYTRINQYGITENRYFIVVLACWLFCLSIYFLFSNVKSIKVIPVTLFIITLLSSFGPWGAFSVARHSQVKQLKKILTKAGILVNEKIIKLQQPISFSNGVQITSIVDYLDKMHNFDDIKPWFKTNIDSLIKPDSINRYRDKSQIVLAQMGLDKYKYLYRGEQDTIAAYFNFISEQYTKIEIKNFDYFLTCQFYNYPAIDSGKMPENKYLLDKEELTIKFDNKKCTLQFCLNDTLLKDIKLSEITSKVEIYKQQHPEDSYTNNLPLDLMSYKFCVGKTNVKLYFKNIYGNKNNQILNIDNLELIILIKLNDENC